MSGSIHTTKKDLPRERKFAAQAELPPVRAITGLEQKDIQKRIHKLNATLERQAQHQAAPAHAHVTRKEKGIASNVRLRGQK